MNTNLQYGHIFFDAMRVAELRASEAAKYDVNYFQDDYWKEDIVGKIGNRGLAYSDPGHIQRFNTLHKGIEAIANGNSYLDVGCGTGILVEIAIKNGKKICGIDLAQAAIDEFQNRTQGRWPDAVIKGDCKSLPFSNASFDVLLCFDVLEHLIVFDCFNAVSEICRVAKNQVVASINLDNPYKYHPTILSRETWTAMFEATGMVVLNKCSTEKISQLVSTSRPEYDFFVFDRIL